MFALLGFQPHPAPTLDPPPNSGGAESAKTPNLVTKGLFGMRTITHWSPTTTTLAGSGIRLYEPMRPRFLDSLGVGNSAVTTHYPRLSSGGGLPSRRVPTDAQL